jgi:hypothetical protein
MSRLFCTSTRPTYSTKWCGKRAAASANIFFSFFFEKRVVHEYNRGEPFLLRKRHTVAVCGVWTNSYMYAAHIHVQMGRQTSCCVSKCSDFLCFWRAATSRLFCTCTQPMYSTKWGIKRAAAAANEFMCVFLRKAYSTRVQPRRTSHGHRIQGVH